MIQPDQSTSTIRLARVTHVYPEGQSMDVIFLDTGDFGRNVQVMSPMAGTDFGFTSGIPSPEEEGHEPNLSDDPDKRTITCVVASAGGVNICLGFLYPQVTQMAFGKEDHKNRMIERHASDFYRTVSDDGDADWVHPSGARLRIGNGEAADDLKGKDFDGRWELKRNNEKSVAITLWNDGSKVQILPGGDIIAASAASIQASAIGHITATANGNITANAGANATVTAGGSLRTSAAATNTVQSSSMVEVTAPVIYLNGAVVFGGPAAGAFGGGGSITFQADIIHEGDMWTTGSHWDEKGGHDA